MLVYSLPVAGTQHKVQVVRPETEGLSPKVWLPLLVGALAVIALFVTHHDDEAMTVLVSVVSYAGLGIAAKPGTILARPLSGEDVKRRLDE